MRSLGIAYEEQAAGGELSEHWSGPPELVVRSAALAGTRRGHLVVDVGCGVGGPSRALAAFGCRVVAVDVLPAVIRAAADRTEDGTVMFAAADAETLPLEDEVFDQVWCLGTLAHVRDPLRFAREAARVLRPAGVVVLTEAFWAGIRTPRFAATAPRPWRPLQATDVLALLRRAGLEPTLHPWPAHDVPGALQPADEALRRDLADGRLRPALVLARKEPE
jgi:SAM-dependent methyltransferase